MPKKSDDTESCSSGINWWVTLVVAVIAVPSFGVIAAIGLGSKGVGEVIVFIVACWACTYLGMKLMHNPKMAQKVDIHELDKQSKK